METLKYNVIIADDLQQHIESLAETLKAAGRFNVVFKASDGREVIEYLSGKPPFDDRQTHPLPHVVLLDIRMLHVGAFQVLRWIGENHVPVVTIVVTSFANPDFEATAKALGAAAVLSKPLTPDDALCIAQLASQHFSKAQGG